MKIDEHSFSYTVLGKTKSKAKSPESAADKTRTDSDGVSISSQQRLKKLMKDLANSDVDAEQMLGKVASSMDGDRYLPSAEDVADAILDDMSLLGEIFQWSDSQDS